MEQTSESEGKGSQAKEMTAKQFDLLKELLDDNEELKEAERYVLGQILESKVSNSRDASVLISHILGLLNFRRQFSEQ